MVRASSRARGLASVGTGASTGVAPTPPPRLTRRAPGLSADARCAFAGQRLARLPEPLRRRIIPRRHGRRRDLALDEISAVRDLRRRGEVDDGVGALLGRKKEWP